MKVYVLCSGEPDSEIYGVFPTEDEAVEWAVWNGPQPNNRHVVETEFHTISEETAEEEAGDERAQTTSTVLIQMFPDRPGVAAHPQDFEPAPGRDRLGLGQGPPPPS